MEVFHVKTIDSVGDSIREIRDGKALGVGLGRGASVSRLKPRLG
jgi:hypothetical protein